MKKFYKDFDVSSVKDKATLQKQELYNLFKRPPKERSKEMAHYNQTYSANVDHQADLLFLPDDNGFKYALVVTDIATRLSDAEPLKKKDSAEVAKAIEKIYKRGILQKPEFLTVDAGTEFKGVLATYLKKNNISVRTAKPNRHRQVAMVERTNQYLAKHLFMRMQAQELLTGETSKEWVHDLPKAITAINRKRKRDPPKVQYHPVCSGDDCNVLEVGTKVRFKLDAPLDYVTDKKLTGKFRITDIRWDPHPRVISEVLLMPGQPPMYLLNDEKDINKVDRRAAYTKKQLQVVPQNEEAPPPDVIRGKPTTYIVQKLVEKKKMGNRIYYKVRWKGYPPEQDTWELRSKLVEDVPLLVKEYDNLNK